MDETNGRHKESVFPLFTFGIVTLASGFWNRSSVTRFAIKGYTASTAQL
jgi:hypothetical protein